MKNFRNCIKKFFDEIFSENRCSLQLSNFISFISDFFNLNINKNFPKNNKKIKFDYKKIHVLIKMFIHLSKI